MNPKSKIDLIQERIRGFRQNTDFVATLFEGLTGYANIAADFDGNIIAYSEEGRKIYGYSPEEVIGKQSIEILFPKNFSQTGRLQQIINDLHEKEKLSYEGEMIRKNGDTFPAQIVLGLTKNKNGKIVGFVLITQDLTERNRLLEKLKRQSQDLQLSQESFYNIVEKSADGVIVVDREGIVQFINQAAISQFKLKSEEFLGRQFGEPIVSGEVTEVDILRTDGTKGLAEMRVVDTDWDGKDAKLALLRDITERKRTEELLVRQERLAAMGVLASVVGHEVRGPLSVIKNSAEFLQIRLGRNLDEKVKRHLDILQEEVNASDKIIDDILGFARVKQLETTTVDAKSMVEAAIKRVAMPANIEIVRKFGTDFLPVDVDISQMGRAFFNIITNAIDAMSNAGTLTLVTRAQDVWEQGPRFVEISFQDTGVGIPKEDLDKIFKPLFTTKSKGTGLGMATCQNIVHAHKGEIEVESELGKGTIVSVRLPAQGLNIKD